MAPHHIPSSLKRGVHLGSIAMTRPPAAQQEAYVPAHANVHSSHHRRILRNSGYTLAIKFGRAQQYEQAMLATAPREVDK